MRYLIALAILVGISACLPVASTFSPSDQEPTQLGARQLEVRTLDVAYDVAYRAASQAFFSLGYSIGHSDKASGILTGTRMTGVKESKEDQQTKAVLGGLSLVPYIGILGALGALAPTREPTALQVTVLLQPSGQSQTQIRFKMQANGEPVWDQVTIDRLWVTTQREAMIESGPPPTNPQAPSPPGQKVGKPTPK